MEHELEEVFAWLEAGAAADYQGGVLVLQKHSGNRSLVNLLLKKESAANREKLVYELVKVGCGGRMEDVSEVLNHFAQAVQGAVPQVAGQAVEVLDLQPEQPDPAHVPDELRPQLDELTQHMGKLHNQRVQLSNSLADLSEDDAPAVVAQTLALQEQYNELAQQRVNGVAGEPTAPEQPAPSPEQSAPEAPAPGSEQSAAPGIDRAEVMKKRNSLRSNLSKAKKKAEESKTEEKRSEYAQKAAKLAVELDQVELQLKQ
jgi:hypothetical protein